jgi:MFS family permease
MRLSARGFSDDLARARVGDRVVRRGRAGLLAVGDGIASVRLRPWPRRGLHPLLAKDHASRGTVSAFLVIGMTLTGLAYGPMSAGLPELFPTNIRYSGSGVSFNIASIIGAAVTPFIVTWLTVRYGVGCVGLYLIFMALLSIVAQVIMPETKAPHWRHPPPPTSTREPTVESAVRYIPLTTSTESALSVVERYCRTI